MAESKIILPGLPHIKQQTPEERRRAEHIAKTRDLVLRLLQDRHGADGADKMMALNHAVREIIRLDFVPGQKQRAWDVFVDLMERHLKRRT
jgi:hypothetical protein